MPLMLQFAGPLGVWKMKRQGSDDAAAAAPVHGASRYLEGETARL